MSENLMDPTTSGVNNEVGPNFFGYYTSEVAELMSQDEGLLPFSHPISHLAGKLHEVGTEKGSTKNSKTIERNGINGSSSLFSNGIGALLSEFKKERLKYLLRQSVFTLTKEVDESHPNACGTNPKNGSIMNSDTEDGNKCAEIDDDLRFLLENDTAKVEELMKNHSNELSATLHYMEQKLEELLDTSMTSCRPMTLAEKQQLRKSIQNLPPRNLDRVVEIIGRNKPSDKDSCDELHVDLDKMDNVTVWRLYFYITTIQANTP